MEWYGMAGTRPLRDMNSTEVLVYASPDRRAHVRKQNTGYAAGLKYQM
jgi:hypothetical protein